MEYPRHLAIIMDGNGRWAKKQGKQRLFGHRAGTESVRACCEYAAQHKIEYLSLFAFSQENWNRPQEEVDGLMSLMVKTLKSERKTFMRNGIKFRVVGDRARLPQNVLTEMEALESATAGNPGTTLLLFLSYSGKWDIVQAAQRYAMDCVERGVAGPLTDDVFADYLGTRGVPEPDLLIRTSGEQRISNFMLWQCAYTEFYYTSVLWPDFSKADLDLAVEEFSRRQRRYGEVK